MDSHNCSLGQESKCRDEASKASRWCSMLLSYSVNLVPAVFWGRAGVVYSVVNKIESLPSEGL